MAYMKAKTKMRPFQKQLRSHFQQNDMKMDPATGMNTA